MPKAAIDEDGDALLSEDDVGGTPQRRLRPVCNAVSETGGMEAPTYRKLRDGVTGPVALHHLPRGAATRPTLVRRHTFITPE